MKKTFRACLVAFAVALTVPLASAAQAQTCKSVCNQVRRACTHAAKGAWKAARIVCDEQVVTCAADCEANAATCPGDCEAAGSICEAGCAGDTECLAACASTQAQCLDDCINCVPNCDTARELCLDTAAAERSAMRAVCSDSRDLCNGGCVDPLDRSCVRGCTTDEHSCRGAAKRVEVGCKKNCSGGTGQRACIRTCRKDNNLAQQLCEDTAVLCYAGCAGVDLTPTPPTTMAP